MRVRRLIIQYDADIGPNEDDMKDIREQFEKEDIIFLDSDYTIQEVEYDELAIVRKMPHQAE